MFSITLYAFTVLSSAIFSCHCQQYDFAAEITRQCLVPDPVGLLDCVENKVTLPYLTSWVDCTNSLGQNVRTSADIINYRCKSVWEGKGVIPEVFYIKDCVIEKTGLPAKNVSAEVLGAYKECERTPTAQQQRIKTAPPQQQLRGSSVEYKPPTQNFQAPIIAAPPQPVQVQIPIQRVQAMPVSQPQLVAPRQSFQLVQPRMPAPMQQQIQTLAPRPVQQIPAIPVGLIQQNVHAVPNQQIAVKPQMMPNPMNQPYSYQYFVIHPRAPIPNQQQSMNKPILSQKTTSSLTGFVPQQQMLAATPQVISTSPNAPYSYSFQVSHPMKQSS